MSHGHVKPNPDGSVARCGGGHLCVRYALAKKHLWSPRVRSRVQPEHVSRARSLLAAFNLCGSSSSGLVNTRLNQEPVADSGLVAMAVNPCKSKLIPSRRR